MQGERVVTEARAAELLERAQDVYRRARRDEALDLLCQCGDWPAPYNEEALLLRAEVLTARDPISGLEELAAHSGAFTSRRGRIGYLIASARAYARARNADIAEEMLDSAEAELNGETGVHRDQIAYLRAWQRWNKREYNPQDADLAIAIRSEDPAVSISALNLRGWMYAGLEDFASQMQELLECVRLYQQHGHRCDLASVALIMQNTLVLAWELNDAKVVAEAEAALNTIEWTAEIEVRRFLCLRALAWHSFLQGESARAQWLFKDSKDHAPTPAWKVMAHVDRAFVARTVLNEAWATEELYHAHGIARTIEWQTTRDEERMALITLAVMFAPIDLGVAQRYVSTYIQLGTESLDPTLGASHEPRRSIAHQKYAAGRVQAMLGNTTSAIRALEGAYEIFSQIEHDYRAALAAQALYDLTGDQTWLTVARGHATKFPNSALAERLNEGREGSAPQSSSLTMTQRQIAIAHCQGADSEELSGRFSRSTFTIEKQLQAIYEALGVRNRTALRDELHRRGLL
jgi:DNA-binding CsgD family transcriptional regulator